MFFFSIYLANLNCGPTQQNCNGLQSNVAELKKTSEIQQN